MKAFIKNAAYILIICRVSFPAASGQEVITAAGGTATGTGGSVTYTVGQLVFNQVTGSTGFIIQGVQQPYEISVITAVVNTEDISLDCIVYPNPTHGSIKLVIKSFNDENMVYRLYNMEGLLLQEKRIEDTPTVISPDRFPYGIYFIKILKARKEIKVFKIINK